MTRIPSRMRHNAPPGHPLAGRRRGTIILFAMICLLLVSLLGASLVKLALTQRRQIRREQWRVQATWLAEAAVDRAAARLATETDYSGETWTIAPTELGGESGAQVRISVEEATTGAERFVVQVTADYPDSDEQRARVSKRIAVIPHQTLP